MPIDSNYLLVKYLIPSPINYIERCLIIDSLNLKLLRAFYILLLHIAVGIKARNILVRSLDFYNFTSRAI